jgi:hypothetical protein
MARSRINLVVSGPIFDGRAEAAVRAWLDDAKQQVADMGVKELDAITMDRSGRGTGRYQSTITTRAASYGDVVIYARDYWPGPWLEGTTKRNASTRFKGYHLWRRTRIKLARKSADIARDTLRKYIGRMGGHT